jgi:hypothetical protein
MVFKDSMVGAQSKVNGPVRDLSIGDYTEMGDAN